jgi:tRNA dimethylallyltransferase
MVSALFTQIEPALLHPYSAVCIAGATASGKSALALSIAKAYHGIIINGDSRQVYQGLPLLTAQPSLEDLEQAPHELYQYIPNVAPGINVTTWAQDARARIVKAHTKGQLPILVGGTGFYLKTLEEGLSFVPEVPRMTEELFQEQYGERRPYAVLQSVDPVCALNITPENQQRILRALSVYYYTGKPLSHWWSFAKTPLLPNVQWIKLYCDGEKACLKKRIETRFHTLCTQGLLEEVAAFSAKEDTPLHHSIGLSILQQRLAGGLSWQETEERFCTATWQYAKAQRTWFKRYFEPLCVLRYDR